MRIDHINIVVKNLEKMIAFYRDVLGLTLTKQVTIRGEWIESVVGLEDVEAEVVYLDAQAGPRIELIDYRSPRGSIPADRDQPNTHGLRHLAFQVDDIDAMTANLRANNVNFTSDIQQVPDSQVTYTGGVRKRLIYFNDPEGNILELCKYK